MKIHLNHYNSYIKISLGYFVLLALLGSILRIIPFVDLPINFGYFVHTHSHIALLGWGYLALSTIMAKLFLGKLNTKLKNLFWFTQITLVGMLISFPLQGYALFSIIFSTLFLFASYYFVWLIFNHTKAKIRKTIGFKFARHSLVFLAVSSLGPWALGIIMNTLGSDSIWYRNAIYFYLHFMYNGFFLLGILGVGLALLNPEKLNTKALKKSLHYIVTGTILSTTLSFLWSDTNIIFLAIGFIGLISCSLGLFKFFQHSIREFQNKLSSSSKTNRLVGWLILIFLILKTLCQFASCLPTYGILILNNKPLILAYLHMIFLGIVSLALLLFLNLLKITKPHHLALYLYMIGFGITEFILAHQGLQAFIELPSIAYSSEILAAGSLLLCLAIMMIWTKQFSPTSTS